MRPSELSDLLWAQVDRVAPHLLPNGKKEGHEWVAGNVNGDKGNSLKVNLSGKKKWADFAEGDGGDMLDLWMACRGINLHQAMQEAKAFLGIKDDDHHFDAKREKKFSRPDRKKIARYVTRTESHLEYLQSRGISPEVVKRYEVVSGKVWNGERELDALVIPYKRDGELLQVKRISTERPDGKKVIMAEGDCEPCLFGWQALDAGVRAVVLCEGEIDCMSYAQYGISALSVPFGGGKGAKQQWIEFEYHNLDRFEEIFISMDVDDVGREAAREIASRLGEHRCRLVTLPYKDINECLMNGVIWSDEQLPESGKYWSWRTARSGKRRANICQQYESDFAAKCGSCSGKCQQTISNAICYWRRCVWCYCWGRTCEINWFINSVGGCDRRRSWSAWLVVLRGNQWLRGNRVLILVVFWLASVRKMRMRQRQATLTQRLV